MGTTLSALDCTQTVNAIVAAHPATLAVFNAWWIDTCCGGNLAVEEVVRRHNLDGPALCAALTVVANRG